MVATRNGPCDLLQGRHVALEGGFGLIERFSEDLDLQIDSGSVDGLPDVTGWTSAKKGPSAKRREFFTRLTDFLKVPSCAVTLDANSLGDKARGANYRVEYPGAFAGDLAEPFRPFVLLEVGRARVHPFDERSLSSFVHDKLEADGLLEGYDLNRPRNFRCHKESTRTRMRRNDPRRPPRPPPPSPKSLQGNCLLPAGRRW